MGRIVGLAAASLLAIVLTGCAARTTTFQPELRSVDATVAPIAAARSVVPRALTTRLAKKEAPVPQPLYRVTAPASSGTGSRTGAATTSSRRKYTYTPPDFSTMFQSVPRPSDDDDV